jgi:predicted Zn-dependent protease
MRHRSFPRLLSLLLVGLLLMPAPISTALAQEKGAAQSETPEEKKLRERQESLKKKEEERKEKEAKARTKETKKYNTLKDFAEELYASDPEFRDQVDDAYRDLQSSHADEAYRINTSPGKEYLYTENGGELKIRRALYDNPRVQEYVNRLGQSIVPDDSESLYAFRVTVHPIPAAYTLSTGTILITTGMISVLDNEAQLAYVLAHELAHVHKDHWKIKVMMPLAEEEYNEKQEKKRARWGLVAGLAGGLVGGALNGQQGALIGGSSGLLAGYAISSLYSKKLSTDWATAQENEADDFALKAALSKSYDIQEVPRLYEVMARVARSDSRTQLGFLGSRGRIRERTEYAQKVLNGALQGQYQEALKSGKLLGTSPEYNLIMAELKRDNGIEAYYFDMFQMARMNLQQSVTLRSDDALAAYYYGRVMKQVGRTKEDLDTAQQYLTTAIRLDTRQNIPEVQLHRALMLMDRKDPTAQTEAVAALKLYVTAFQRRRLEHSRDDAWVPPNVDILYDYMRLLGDKMWKAPSYDVLLKQLAAGQALQPQPVANNAPASAAPAATVKTTGGRRP